jgi:hypothetical protein
MHPVYRGSTSAVAHRGSIVNGRKKPAHCRSAFAVKSGGDEIIA